MAKPALLIVLISLILISCSKEEDKEIAKKIDPIDSSDTEVTNPFFPLAVGNYWVFEWRQHQLDGSVGKIQAVDTMIIKGDSLVGNDQYYILASNYPFHNSEILIRNVNGQIERENGQIILPAESNMKTYNDHYGFGQDNNDTLYYFWQEFPIIENHPTKFGNFDCLVQKDIHESYLQMPHVLRTDTSLYSEIGPMQRSFSYLFSGSKSKGKLIDYHLKE